MHRPGRKEHTLLRDDQLNESLLGGRETAEKLKESASVLRLLALAKNEAWVRPNLLNIHLL
jgi:hypothetical protein